MKSCNRFIKMFSEYIDNALDDYNKSRLDDHLASCTECQSSLHQMKNLQTLMGSMTSIRSSETFDTVMHARLVQQARHESRRMQSRRPFSFLVNFKTPAYVAAAVMLVFLGTVLQKYYGAIQENRNIASQFSDIPNALVEKASAVNPGYMVVTQRDTASNTIVITNYVHLDEMSPRRNIAKNSASSIPLGSLPNLKDAPTRQTRARPFSPNASAPKIQYAKEYVF